MSKKTYSFFTLLVIMICCLGLISANDSKELEKNVSSENNNKLLTETTSQNNEETITVKKSFKTKEEAENYLKELESKGYIITSKKITQDSHEEIITLERTFETEEEAESLLNAFKETYNDASGVINHYTTTEKTGNIIEELASSTENTEVRLYVFNTETDANNKKEELENSADGKYVQISVTINHSVVDSGEDETLEIEKTFESKEAAEEYLEQLESDGYTITNKELTQDSHENTVTLEKTFETKKEAEEALEEFENKYDNVTSDPIAENKTEEEIEAINGETAYSTEEEAKAALEEFLNDPNNETDEFYFTGSVVGPKGTGTYETSPINETFANEQEALDYLESLKNDGYTIVDYKFTKDTEISSNSIEQKFDTREAAEEALANFTAEYPDNVESDIKTVEAGTVYEAQTITSDMKIYQFNSATFILIKKGHDVYVWTENELDSSAQAKFKETYRQVASDNVLTGDVVASNKTKFISGYNEFTSSNGKKFSFYLDENNEIKIDMASGAESRVVTGTFEPVNQYVLTASGNKKIEKDSGVLTGNIKKEILGYYNNLSKKAKNYTVSASGTETVLDDSYSLKAKATKDIMKDEYSLDVKTIENTYITYDETYEKDWYNVVASATAKVLDDSYTLEAEARKNNNIEVMPPKTGITKKENNYLPIILFIISVYELLLKNNKVKNN
ncbi:MAG: SPOR domain-containing protein [Bacilli bacterium]|nr:SPOR domain-containing protein [Bacilli bacterium]